MMIVTKSVPFLHPLQSHAWGNFRKTQGQKVVRFDSFQVFFYSIPHLPYSIGYLPKGPLPTKSMIKKLKKMGKKYRAIFIKMEPNIKKILRFLEGPKSTSAFIDLDLLIFS